MNRKIILLAVIFALMVVLGYNLFRFLTEDPRKTLVVSEATVRVYFDPQGRGLPLNTYLDPYKGRTPDPEKHRIVEYWIESITNTGSRKKNFVIVEAVIDSFRDYVINGTYLTGPSILGPGGFQRAGILFLTEGDPEMIKKLVSQSYIMITWEERGKKWVRIVPVKLIE